jgi:PLP dependent protein
MEPAENLAMVKEQIERACERSGRKPDSVALLAVSKGQPPEAVDALIRAGQLLFGENKIQEAKVKIPECSGRATWDFIGHLQTNKCRDAVGMFRWIHSIDSMRLAEEVARWAERLDRKVGVLLEVNVAGEASKFGYGVDRLLSELPALGRLPRLEIRGLMTLAPWKPDPEQSRPVFRRLEELRRRCEDVLQRAVPELSMGMSGDYGIAIEEGATVVRVGTALFGPRGL